MNFFKYGMCIASLALMPNFIKAQLWSPMTNYEIVSNPISDIVPASYSSYYVDFEQLKSSLVNLVGGAESISISLPMPDGSNLDFRIKESSIMESTLALKYPQIKTFIASGVGIEAWGRLDITDHGFHAMLYMPEGDIVFIDPYNSKTKDYYKSYWRSEFYKTISEKIVCEVEQNAIPGGVDLNPQAFTVGGKSRTFRLALACTEEYSAAVGGSNPTKSAVLSAMVTSINRVNTVYQNDLNSTLQLIAKTDTLIYLPGTNDPYNNNDGAAMLNQNQTNVNSLIGTSNYDIGHVFSTGGGGIARASSLCISQEKSKGVTGSPSPVGDPFDIDYVAHEVGHQFGADHTFNAFTGACQGNGITSSAYEPGSGSTIMAYAGICDPINDLQNNSDPYFHTNSLYQINAKLNTVGSCGVNNTSSNALPTLNITPTSYNVPLYTAYEFENLATDNNNPSSQLSYNWEQKDLGNFGGDWSNTAVSGPIMRSYRPVRAQFYTLPVYSRLRNNQLYVDKAGYASQVARTLHFNCVVRDNNAGSGGVNVSDNTLTVNTVNTGDTFKVTSNVSGTYNGFSPINLTWKVAGTTGNNINCANVDISFTADSGKTWIPLASNTPNDGSETVALPNLSTSQGKIKVKGHNNIFIALNNNYIVVNKLISPDAILTHERLDNLIYPNPTDDVFNINLGEIYNKGQKILILNSIGMVIKELVLANSLTSVNCDDWSSGLYYISLIDSNSRVLATGKVIKK